MTPKFYVNHGRRCAQAVMRSFCPEKSWKDLDELTGRRKEDLTLPVQMAYGFSSLNIPFIYPVTEGFFEQDLEKVKEQFKSFGEHNFLGINFDFVNRARKKLADAGKYVLEREIDWRRIQEALKKRLTPILLINYDLLVEREDKQRGHYLTLVGIEGGNAIVMDCGPCDASPNRKIPQKKLERYVMQTPLDLGVIFV